ncbi:MAG: hypothetical protein CVT63_00010 [Candidatus Anoxymicrobium japonicum]|uniref:Metallo-beta-lactamase domain-containing protein n=1 Tax=Candidatus Anoxymicrobium japonicum TaxID=2013648 RepID=A0A2N3G888_9ACTN|nr:MAG: hypothetical protein CVT63_00010 [Candidatus Anoxymicrobium japonicum]
MSLKVTVCGSSGGYAGAGKACSGFLLQSESGTLLLDIGAGVLSNVLKHIEADQLDGLALTHMHYDHYSDIYGLCTARCFRETALPALPVLATADAKDIIASPLAERSRPGFFKCVKMIAPIPGEEIDIAGFNVMAKPSEHVVDGFIYRINVDDRTICYSGDTGRCDAVLEMACDVDLFICESTFTSEWFLSREGHLDAFESGQIAADAGVKSLLLTHLWPTLDPEIALVEASTRYNGPVDIAVEGLMLFVGPYPCAT